MRALAKKIVERFVRPVHSFLAPGGLVFGYHRISDSTWDPLNLAISRRNFREQLEIMADRELLQSIARAKSNIANKELYSMDEVF